MGLNIREIIPRTEIELSNLKGKIICVDAFNALYQFLSTIKQPDGTPLMDDKKRITSHLSGIFYRNISLLSEGIRLIYVFDGKAPELKQKTWKNRKENRDAAREKYESAKQEENFELMRKYSGQLIRLDDGMIAESKELLDAMGIPVIQAPSEGEAEAAYLCRKNENIYASVSQDYDSLLFGTKRLIRNLAISRKKKNSAGVWSEINPELIELEKVLNTLGINLDQLICLGILVGTDYNPKGIPGIGQKKALEIVQKYRQPVLIFDFVKDKLASLPEEEQFDWKEIFEIFKKHDVSDANINFQKIDGKKIRRILVEEHNFSEERIQNQLDKFNESEKKNKQKNLEKWF